MTTRRQIGALAVLAAPRLATAQPVWPGDRPIEVIVPFPPGGGVDSMTRFVLPQVQAQIPGARFIVVNRAGAGGQLGWEQAQAATPDGFTLAAVSVPALVTYPIEAAMVRGCDGVFRCGSIRASPSFRLELWRRTWSAVT